MVCVNASAVMSGAFPLMYIISRVFARPLKKLGNLMGINEHAAVGFVSSLATSATTFGLMEKMDKKGTLLNSAFATSAAFTFAGHLAYTLAFPKGAACLGAVIVCKLLSGVTSLLLAYLLFCRKPNGKAEEAHT